MGRDINGVDLKRSFLQANVGHFFSTLGPLDCDEQGEDKEQALELHLSNTERSKLATRFK